MLIRVCKSLVVFSLLFSCNGIFADTVWQNFIFWFKAAQQHNITTGLIQVVEKVGKAGGCHGALLDETAQAHADQIIAFMEAQEGFSISDPVALALRRMQAAVHFFPDFVIPEDQAVWNGNSIAAAKAFLEVNQHIDVDSAVPYIQALLIVIQRGY